MATPAADVLASIRTLLLPDDAQALFSRAVRLVQQRPGDFATVAAWLGEHYSETSLQEVCEQEHRRNFAGRLRRLRWDSPTYRRRLAIQNGRALSKLKTDRVEEARLRGQRLEGKVVATRQPDFIDPLGAPINQKNVHWVWRWEDEQYRRQFREIQAQCRAAKWPAHHHPEKPDWRIRRAIEDLVAAEYPDGEAHVEHSRRIVALAALLMPERLPTLGELGEWPFASELDSPSDDGPHAYGPTILDVRTPGREEVLFVRMRGEPRHERRDFPLDDLLKVLHIALDKLEGYASSGPVLSQREMNILVAMLGQDAIDSDSRLTTVVIADKAEGKQANPEGFKETIAQLVKRGLLGSKAGRGGGCWLTDAGRQRAEQI